MHTRYQKRIQKTAERRRGVLIKNLGEQLNLLQATINGDLFVSPRKVWKTNEDGERVQIERPKRIRPWFWVSWSGICFFQVWYGSKIVELKPGMTCVEVEKDFIKVLEYYIESKEKLVEAISAIIEAVKSGDLDIPIENVAEKGLAEIRLNYKFKVTKQTK